jgi:hypothetical protein
MTSFYDEMKEKIESATEDFRDQIYEELVIIRNRCRLDQYSKRDLEEEIDNLLRRIY